MGSWGRPCLMHIREIGNGERQTECFAGPAIDSAISSLWHRCISSLCADSQRRQTDFAFAIQTYPSSFSGRHIFSTTMTLTSQCHANPSANRDKTA